MKLHARPLGVWRALDDWQARGLLPPDIAARLRDDLATRRRPAFASFALVAGAVCLGLAVISFVAANWDEMARGWRLLLVLAALAGAWAGVALAVWRGWPRRAEALAVLATLIFGAAIALVGQIYQLQGDLGDVLQSWAAGSLAGALLTRKRAALGLAVVLGLAWNVTRWDTGRLTGDDALLLAGLALAGIGALGLQATRVGQMVLAGALVWAGAALLRSDAPPDAVTLALTVLAGFMALALAIPTVPGNLRPVSVAMLVQGVAALWLGLILLFLGHDGWDMALGPVLIWALPGCGMALGALAWGWRGPTQTDLAVALCLVALVALVVALPVGPWPRAALALAVPVWAIVLGGRLEVAALRGMGTAGFAITLAAIYLQTVGSLLGTAGFYGGAGLILIVAAGLWQRWGRTP